MHIIVEKLKELLVGPGHVSEADFESAVKEATEKKVPLEDLLAQKGLISDENLGKTIAEAFGYKFINLKKEKIDDDVLRMIPELVARSKGVIAFARTEPRPPSQSSGVAGGEGVKVGMTDPDDLETKHLIEKRVGQKILPYFITKQSLAHAFAGYKAGLKDEIDKVLARLNDQSLAREERDESIVKMVDTLLAYGYQNNASDVHIEPYLKKILVRFRIDGVLHDVLDLSKELADLVLTRIKILSKMRTDEHRAAQDGKLRFEMPNEVVDVRVSVAPVTEGENVVMRLLAAKGRRFDLTSLGLLKRDMEKIEKTVKNPHGMILVTGPTGSGKTTTLYAIMKILNKREVHISTIEDPVEYDIEGVSQIQVNPKTNLTFAKGLRAIVRQDPDIIMVGEIRDEETAGIAVNAALTGHLVLSTLHTNDAATTLPRLLDMGIKPFLVASTVNVAIAQRLIRKICERCRASYDLTSEEKTMLESLPEVRALFDKKRKVTLYKGAGCKVCGNTGYAGRVGIFEVLEMVANVKELILKRASSDEIMKVAKANGMTTMLEDGIEKVFNAVTTLEEVLRVTRE